MASTRRGFELSVVHLTAVALLGLAEGLVPPAIAFEVYRLGGDGPNPWGAALSLTPGEYLTVGPDGAILGRGTVAAPAVYQTWNDTLVEMVDSTGGQWLRPYLVPDTLNLARDGVRERVPRGIWSNLATSDAQCSNASAVLENLRAMFDGDPRTASFFTASPSEDPEIRWGYFVQNTIVELGADYPVNRIRFYPRLGRGNPRIGELLEEMGQPHPDLQDLLEEDFSLNYLPWYEVAGASSRAGFDENCSWYTQDRRWFYTIPQGLANAGSANDPNLTVIERNQENSRVVVDIRFPVRPLQWVAIRPLYPTRNWEIAELEVFGSGHVGRAVYTSAVLDMGRPVVWGRIRWSGDRDEEARVVIRTRSGDDPDPNRYQVLTPVPGEFREATREEYMRASTASRRLLEDEENWDFWTSPYEWESGLHDPSGPAHLWRDGAPIRSAGPARYFQFQVVFRSTQAQTARLADLEVQLSRAAAAQVVGEVWPLDVSRLGSTTFTYSVRPRLEAGDRGFDRLEIFTLTRADTVRQVLVDGVDVTAQFPPVILDDRIQVGFPRLAGPADTFKLIAVRFDTRVVRYGTQFTGWVYDSQGNEVKQMIRPGDADAQFPGNDLGVRTGSLGAGLLSALEVGPNPISPNGDGINDEVRFRFQVHELEEPRALRLTILDLAGRPVRRLDDRQVVRGVFGGEQEAPSWDGRDDGGRPVAPGLYLFRLQLEADRAAEARVGVVAVVH